MLQLRKYSSGDIMEISTLFYDTVHNVNSKDYTKSQLDAWATGSINYSLWDEVFLQHDTVIACIDDKIVGFGDIDSFGYFDKLYVHKDFQRQGIASAIVYGLLDNFIYKEGVKLTTYSSITAVPFFKHLGFEIVCENVVVKGDVRLVNFLMERVVCF